MSDINLVWSTAGLEPTPPATIRTTFISKVSSIAPDYTVLPAGLIEDLTSTAVGGLSLFDSSLVTMANSVTPLGANPYYLTDLGTIYGVSRGTTSRTSVYVVFSGTPGLSINPGFTVSDGTNQYSVVDGGIIQSNGTSNPLYCLATTDGTWAVPENTVTAISTSVPPIYTVTCNNPTPGTAGTSDQEPWDDYRARVLEAGYSPSQGCASYLKARLKTVPGVQARLVSVQPRDTGWEILCGGGDPYAIAYQIYMSMFDPLLLIGSATTERNVTASVLDYPDTYDYVFVNPVAQTVSVTVTWNTSATNVISNDSIASLASAAVATYINSIYAGKPINIYDMEDAFRASISTVVPQSLVVKMTFAVYINSTLTPAVGGIVSGDSEGYFSTDSTKIHITRG